MIAFLKRTPHTLFSFDGRIGRGQFWFGMGLMAATQLLATYAFEGDIAPQNYSSPIAQCVILVLTLVMEGAVVVKRLRDLAWPPSLAAPVVLIGFAYSLAALFKVIPESMENLVLAVVAAAFAAEMICCGFLRGKEHEAPVAAFA